MTTEEALKLIETSFLSRGQKAELKQILDNEGTDQMFFELFNKFLISSVAGLMKTEDRLMEEYRKALVDLDADFQTKKESLVKILEQQLEILDFADIIGREKIWQAHEAKLDALEADYQSSIKKIVAKILISNI